MMYFNLSFNYNMKKILSIIILSLLLLVACKENTYDYAEKELGQDMVIKNKDVGKIIDEIDITSDNEKKIQLYDELWEMTVSNEIYDKNIAFEDNMHEYIFLLYKYSDKDKYHTVLDKVLSTEFSQEIRYNSILQISSIITSNDEAEMNYLLERLISLLDEDKKYLDPTIYTTNVLAEISRLYRKLGNEAESEQYLEKCKEITLIITSN